TFVHDIIITSSWPQSQEKTSTGLPDMIARYTAAVLVGVAVVASVVAVIRIRGRRRRGPSIQSGMPSAA
ncbi:MAG: hypothetical protein QXO76_12695, partial [Thermoproteota archaeon]